MNEKAVKPLNLSDDFENNLYRNVVHTLVETENMIPGGQAERVIAIVRAIFLEQCDGFEPLSYEEQNKIIDKSLREHYRETMERKRVPSDYLLMFTEGGESNAVADAVAKAQLASAKKQAKLILQKGWIVEMGNIEDRLDYFEVIKRNVMPWGRHGYECLVCGRKISASSSRRNYMDADNHHRGLTGNARGAMTNHLKWHMRKGDI